MKDELFAAIQSDLGRDPFYGYISELHLVKVEIQHSIDNLQNGCNRQTAVDTPVMVGSGVSFDYPEPLGVINVMSAWNYPSWNYPFYTLLGPASQVTASQVIAAGTAGNCCLMKPSELQLELSPNCSKAVLSRSCGCVISTWIENAIKL